MKIRLPGFTGSGSYFSVTRRKALERRLLAFWTPLAGLYYKEGDAVMDARVHETITANILERLEEVAQALANPEGWTNPRKFTDTTFFWSKVGFVLDFDCDYEFDPDVECETGYADSDTLQGESEFQRSVIAAVRKILLNGASCARFVSSDTYPAWRRLLLDFSSFGSDRHDFTLTILEPMLDALELLQADLVVWQNVQQNFARSDFSKNPNKNAS